jgi:hypothetical protein
MKLSGSRSVIGRCADKFPKCELRSGMRKWKQAQHMLSNHLNQFDDALRTRKRCSEPGAGPYCIREASGLGLMAEWAGLLLTFIGGAAFSVHAIETPGGDDDRQVTVPRRTRLRSTPFPRSVAALRCPVPLRRATHTALRAAASHPAHTPSVLSRRTRASRPHAQRALSAHTCSG